MLKIFKNKIILMIFLPVSMTYATSTYSYSIKNFKKTTYKQLENWEHGNQLKSYLAVKSSCEKMFISGYPTVFWEKGCNAIETKNIKSNKEARDIFEKNFTPYLITNPNSETPTKTLFTGYYEPTLEGSLTKTWVYKTPLYKAPKDLIHKNGKFGRYNDKKKYIPHYSRKEIRENNLFKKEDVIVWVKNDIERQFLQIQGSGRIILPNGKMILVGYDGQNGHPYRPMGKVLVKKKAMPLNKMSMQNIKKWLYNASKKDRTEVLNSDPSFVFFKLLKYDNAIGAEGIELTPGYSVAVDHRFIDYGTPLWIDTQYYGVDDKWHKLDRLMVAQDTGGAIREANHADIFFGNGTVAEYRAGHMNHRGVMYALFPDGQRPK